MKILQLHNRYKYAGGEDVACDQEFELLNARAGYEVERFLVDNSEKLDTLIPKLKLLFSTHYSRRSRQLVERRLSEQSYDVMHVHNFFPLLTPSIFDASSKLGVPSVLTLHNYRLIHPNGLLLHDHEIDERSIDGSAYRCVRDGVYRNSIIQTAVVAHMIEYHRKHGTWHNKVDRFIALSEFAKRKFVDGGLPAERIAIKPNFVSDHLGRVDLPELNSRREPFFLFIGRISEEKGIRTVLEAWEKLQSDFVLKIIGDGPLKQKFETEYSHLANIEWLGLQPHEAIFPYLKRTKALVFPSECYESGSPLTILEAFSMGTPVISSNIGSQDDIVNGGTNGLKFEVGNAVDLCTQIQRLSSDPALLNKLSLNARACYEEQYTPERNFNILQEIYRDLPQK